MSRSILSLLFLLSSAAILANNVAAEEKSATSGDWIQLFNGKDLEGWTPKIRFHELGENFADTFRVEDGLLKVGYDRGYESFDETFGHLFYNQEFSNYRLRVEYRFVGEQCKGGPGWALRNSGIMIHGEDPKGMGLDQNFPTSIEVQLLGGDGSNERTTSNLCTPGTHVFKEGKLFTPHCTSSTSKTYHGDQWVTAEVEVRGNQLVKHIIEGETVLQYSKPQLDPRGGAVSMSGKSSEQHATELKEKNGSLMLSGGTISLQSESHPVHFRKVELMVLED